VTPAQIRTILEDADAVEAAAKRLRERITATIIAQPDGQAFYERSCQGKKKYRTPESAGVAAQEALDRRGDHLRIYDCPFCGGHHLTKEDLDGVVRRAG
jgi:hypothetical protein